jgi:predicted XRE-type DNA-binding protein
LPVAIRERVKAWNLTQEDAAARLDLTRPRLNDLMRGKLDKFSLDALVNIATAAGFKLQASHPARGGGSGVIAAREHSPFTPPEARKW